MSLDHETKRPLCVNISFHQRTSDMQSLFHYSTELKVTISKNRIRKGFLITIHEVKTFIQCTPRHNSLQRKDRQETRSSSHT